MQFFSRLFNPVPENFQHLEIGQYKADYLGQPGHVLIDVRTPGEFSEGHLPGAINIPLDQLPRRVGEVSKGQPIVVVCATGNRSLTGANIIADAGHELVYNLKGGTLIWRMRGGPLER